MRRNALDLGLSYACGVGGGTTAAGTGSGCGVGRDTGGSGNMGAQAATEPMRRRR